ncbi:TetR/AcrR family transcriptional regulator [Pseudorhodoferax sp. Leaf265]|jgi:TetR/AcrR family transcriptional repressor of nem operon|uniref:TetR/AcrR family transcriptional regulator n=1 Tax=Pseudorhodoferax sp. Leaf265 TaxID=1736315 RepID=UPI0006F6F928|nr:TetR/AcrR family transcriptional regulator [Pseudorhodoferax sp. Leaf265]KQP15590.1 TetR family transcriptional regulator [Pseudorhodoferax sp. Leaf265]PZP98999.1 MAG: TetR/AcrR family transcriptional regulator [Variovorax paradoxus]PZQ10630.1 MAG: TetR/AcrR family transcriptional regulator [Variovorax paradoxus]
MARPRQFDEAAALDAAIRCFWSRGYAATSVRDLAEAMGITGPSLYNAFGDKRALYLKAIDHYVENGFCDRVRRFEHQLAPHAAIAAFFDEIVALSLADAEHKGCLVVNAALEVAPHDAEFQVALAAVLGDMESFFLRCVQAGQADGTVNATQAATDLARMLLGLLMGLRVLARARPEPALLRGMVRPVLALLQTGVSAVPAPPS